MNRMEGVVVLGLCADPLLEGGNVGDKAPSVPVGVTGTGGDNNDGLVVMCRAGIIIGDGSGDNERIDSGGRELIFELILARVVNEGLIAASSAIISISASESVYAREDERSERKPNSPGGGRFRL
jgi:hypothetical protein